MPASIRSATPGDRLAVDSRNWVRVPDFATSENTVFELFFAITYWWGVEVDEFLVGVTLEADVAFGGGGAVDEVFVAELGMELEVVEGGMTGLGASTPAVPEPRPSFWRLGASILPLELRPLSD